MLNDNYISSFAIGQVIKQNAKYWQITKLTNPSTGDWFISDDSVPVILCCPSYLSFDDNDLRYIVQEVSVTPVTVKVNEPVKNENNNKNTERLPIGKIITFKDEFYEVIDYRIPNQNEYYVCCINNVLYPYVYRCCGIIRYTLCNIVTKIQPYKRGQVITFNDKSYTVVDYNFPKKDQVIISPPDMNVYINPWIWTKQKAFILEQNKMPYPEAITPKSEVNKDENTEKLPVGTLVTYKNEVYEVIDYRIPVINDYYVYPAPTTMYVYQRRRDDGWPTSYNIVVKIEPYKPGQLIVHNGLIYRVLTYRKGRKGEYMIDSSSPQMVITCETDISFKARWIVEPYIVPIE